MGSKSKQYLAILVAFALIFANTSLSFAEEVTVESADTVGETDPNEGEEFLTRVKGEFDLSKTDYRQLLNNISDTKERLEAVSEEKMTLTEQLANIDDQVAASTEKLLGVTSQVIETENAIIMLYDEIESKGIELEYQKSLLKDYTKLIYQEENNLLNINEDGSIDAFKLLLTDGSVGENMRKLDYFEILNEAGQQMMDKLDQLAKELEGREIELISKKEKLDVLMETAQAEKDQLELQKQSKEQLLKLTEGQEEIYNQLLEQTLKEQEQVINDIKNLGNAMSFIEMKMKEEGDNFDPDNYKSLLNYKTQALYDFQISTLGIGVDGFTWPVDPDRGISAYFRDPGYAGSFGVQHNAVDIPTYQGTPVRAAADGVVYTAKDNGYGYSHITIAHGDGLTTVYGHISSILVSEGLTVAKGSIIGLSGGMPGTLGAGYMTTGPHLHFEVLRDGQYTDPLDYLPLEVLTEDQIGNLPEKYYDDWQMGILKKEEDSLAGF